MTKLSLLALAIGIQSSLSFASTPPEAVPGMDAVREGDLAKSAAAFYASTNPKGCDPEYGKTTYSVSKLSSGSAMDEKVEYSTITYEATYLAISVCNTGSTFSGAYRDVVDAAILKATRTGIAKNGGSPIEKAQNKFVIARKIDPATLSAN